MHVLTRAWRFFLFRLPHGVPDDTSFHLRYKEQTAIIELSFDTGGRSYGVSKGTVLVDNFSIAC